MNIGIIVYSTTGNTLEAARQLEAKLVTAGLQVNLEQITISGEAAPGKFSIASSPAVENYEAVIFASPVQAFSLNPVMAQYLKNISSLQGKKVALLATKHLPFYWTGGNRAISTMSRLCRNKGAKILGSGIVIWSGNRKEKTLNQAIPHLASLFQPAG